MKFIRKKTIKGREYFYFEYPFTVNGKRRILSRYLGREVPRNLPEFITKTFQMVAEKAAEAVDPKAKLYFAPRSVLSLEEAHFWYQSLHHELLEGDLKLFRSLFAILFILNSNRAEGSKVTRKNIEKLLKKQQKPKTQLDIEILNSLTALRFAFSSEMKWTMPSIKTLHRMLFDRIAPHMAGRLKSENVTVSNEPTTHWKFARRELKNLLFWFHKNRKKYYPPILALEFHHRFEGIHPFEDGNGRIGRLLLNAFLLKEGFMPVIFFSENHGRYCRALSEARQGRKRKLAHYFLDQFVKTRSAVLRYKQEGIIRGGSPQVGRWEIERGKIRKY